MKLIFDSGFKLTKKNMVKLNIEESYFLNRIALESFLVTNERFDDDDMIYILEYDNFDRGDFVYSIESIKIEGEIIL